ncbi:MAG: hypothetical protein WA765_06725 [Candidatus Acidiferrum sp.]
MHAQLSLVHSYKCSLYLTVVASLAIFVAPSAKASTTWTITIDVSNGADPPIYGFDYSPKNPPPNCTGLPPMSMQKPEKLYICPGDKVEWNLTTKATQNLLTIHQNRGFQPNGTDTWIRHYASTTASVVSDPSDPGNTYEYCVAAYDDKGTNYQLYSHDPKIIIGGTNVEVEIEQFKIAYTQLLKAIAHDADAKKKAKEQAREETTKINDQVQKLLNLLKK